MSANTKIEWTDHTFNPWWGCQKVGSGCDHCYAETLDKRTGGQHWGPGAERRRTSVNPGGPVTLLHRFRANHVRLVVRRHRSHHTNDKRLLRSVRRALEFRCNEFLRKLELHLGNGVRPGHHALLRSGCVSVLKSHYLPLFVSPTV